MSTSQRAVTPCGWGVKAGIVHMWVAGKTVIQGPQGPYLSALEILVGHYKALYTFTFFCLGQKIQDKTSVYFNVAAKKLD